MGGGDRRLIEIAKRYNKFNKNVICSETSKNICEDNSLHARYFVTSREKTVKNVYITYLLRTLVALKLKLPLENGDVIYANSDFFPDVFPACKAKIRNRNVVWVQIIHHLVSSPLIRGGSRVRNIIAYLAQRLSLSLIKRYSDHIIVSNKLMKEELKEIGFDPKSIDVSSCGVDVKKLKKIEKVKAKETDGIYLGRLHPSKGIFDLLSIWKEVKRMKPLARLQIIGDGTNEIKSSIRKKISELDLEKNIDLLGYVEDSKAFSLMKNSKIFVFPSHEEGFGIVICEAMTCGLPVIAYDLPAYHGIFSKGLTKVRENDISQFASEVIKLLDDDTLRNKQSLESSEESESFDWGLIALGEESIVSDLS